MVRMNKVRPKRMADREAIFCLHARGGGEAITQMALSCQVDTRSQKPVSFGQRSCLTKISQQTDPPHFSSRRSRHHRRRIVETKQAGKQAGEQAVRRGQNGEWRAAQ